MAASVAAVPPNIVLFLQDDEDVLLGGFSDKPLPTHIPAMKARGSTITHWYAHTPVCCPSRAQILTGKTFHNLANTARDRWDTDGRGHPLQCMHINASRLSPGPTFAQHLEQVGYAVGFFGKYLNISPRQEPKGAHTYFVNPGPPLSTSGPMVSKVNEKSCLMTVLRASKAKLWTPAASIIRRSGFALQKVTGMNRLLMEHGSTAT